MKKLLIIAIAGLLFASCEKEEKEKTESDFIVKEYGEDYVLDFHDGHGIKILDYSGRDWGDLRIDIDINDDGDDDVRFKLCQYSDGEYLSIDPLTSKVAVDFNIPLSYMHYGNNICDTTNWNKGGAFWGKTNPASDRYLAVKIETDTSVNYGWIQPLIEPHYLYQDDFRCTVSIVKSAYCKTNGKAIFAGQEE